MEKYQLIILLIFIFILNSCTSTNVTINRSVNVYSIIDTLNYSTYWTAMRCGFPELASKFTDEEDKIKFSKGLSKILIGEHECAERIFREIINFTKNDTLLDNSKIILEQLLIYQSKWKDYFDTFRNKNASDSVEIIRLLYPAFMNNKEVVSYNNQVDTLKIKIKNGLIFIPVKLNDNEIDFLFDTGAQHTIISNKIAQEVGIQSLTNIKSGLISSNNIFNDLQTGLINNLKFGNYQSLNKPCIITNEDNLKSKFLFYTFLRFDAILGWDIIKNLDITIDYDKDIIILKKPLKKESTKKNLFWLDCPIVKVKSNNGYDLLFFYDSGAQNSSFYDLLSKKLNLEEMSETNERIYGIGGSSKRDVKVIPKISFKLNNFNLNFENLKSGLESRGQFFKLDGMLGNDIGLKAGKLHLDASNGIFEIDTIDSK